MAQTSPRHEFAMPGMAAFIEDAEKERANKCLQPLFKGCITAKSKLWRILFTGALMGILQNGCVKAPPYHKEVVVDSGDICVCPFTDIPDGGFPEAVLCEHLNSRLQHPASSCVSISDVLGEFKISIWKQLYKTVV